MGSLSLPPPPYRMRAVRRRTLWGRLHLNYPRPRSRRRRGRRPSRPPSPSSLSLSLSISDSPQTTLSGSHFVTVLGPLFYAGRALSDDAGPTLSARVYVPQLTDSLGGRLSAPCATLGRRWAAAGTGRERRRRRRRETAARTTAREREGGREARRETEEERY